MIHLHTHSMFSLRDSIIKPDELADYLTEIGQKAIAITDHGESLGGVSIYKTMRDAGIKYIHGVEFYVCDDTSIKDKNSRYYHLVALCENDAGRVNLNRLISISEKPENFYFKPRIDFEILKRHSEGLIFLSACMAGEVSKRLLEGDMGAATAVAQRYKDEFGDRYYLEIQSHSDPVQESLNKKILQIALDLSIPYVVTCDAHYIKEEDRKYQNKYAFNGSYKEDGEAYVDCFIQTEDEVRARLSYLPDSIVNQAIEETHRIANRCNVEMPLSAPIMPKVDTPSQYASNKEWLVDLCRNGFETKLNIDLQERRIADESRKLYRMQYDEDGNELGLVEYQITQELIDMYLERYEYELNALDKMGFIDYILLVYSYANVGKRRGIARGSGGGSLINYLTNITNIDPIEHGLYFERFIDVGALDQLEAGEITAKELKIPDIDLDFSGESCAEVLRFLYDKYGEDKVASIGKFGTNKTKGSIRDLCKVLDISLEEADRIAKSFKDYEIDEIDAMIAGELDVLASAKDAIANVHKYPELFEYVRKLNNLPKSFGLHACGKIVGTKDLDEFLPSCYDANGIRYLQGDMHDVEDVGLVKIDVLGLRTLDQEYDTLEQSGESMEFLDPKQSYNNPKVLDIFRTGDTVGIFQFSSPGMRNTLKMMDVQGIDDISAANALFRPGAMAYIESFCNRKHGKEPIRYLHPDLEPILRNTYGIIVFQEQLIEIGRLAGLHNPDLLRKATGKKNPALLAKIKPELEEKLLARGWTQEQFDTLWADMLEFARYSFNKSHSSAYGIIAYMTAKQKAYYPAEFFAGLCNSYLGHSAFVKDEADEILNDAMRHGVKIAPFSFRNDHRRCTAKNGTIFYGVPLIKDCNTAVGEALWSVHNTDERYFWKLANLLVQSGVDKTQLKILVMLGFFGEYGCAKSLLRILDFAELFKYGDRKSIKKSAVEGVDVLSDIVSKYGSCLNTKGEELKTYKLLHTESILDEIEQYILSIPVDDFDFKNKMMTQQQYLGFVSMYTQREEDRPKLLVRVLIPAKRKADGVQFGWNVLTRSIGSGKETWFTIKNKTFDQQPIQVGDIVKCLSYSRHGKFFNLDKYEQILC